MAELDADTKASLDGLKFNAKAAADSFKKADPAYEKAAKELKAAIARDGDSAELDFYRDALTDALDAVDKTVASTKGVMNFVEEIRQKGHAKELAAQIAPILSAIGPMRAKLLAHVTEGRELSKQAAKKREEADTSAGELDADLAAAKDRVKTALGQVGDVPAQTKPIIAAAKKSHGDGKQQEFFGHRQKLHPIAQRRKTLESAKAEVDKLMKKLAKDDRDRRSEAQDLLDQLSGPLEDMDKLDTQIKELMAMPLIKVAAAAPPPKLSMVQVAKIGDKLGIDVGLNAKLSKALNNFPHDKWVKEIAKACNLKEADVKKNMPQVDKLEFVKPLYLIDI